MTNYRFPCAFTITFVMFFASMLPLRARSSNHELRSSPANLRFGSVTIAQSESQTATLTNNGSTNVTISAITAYGSGFTVSGPTLPVTLNQGQSITLNVTFTPQTAGVLNGILFVSGPNFSISLNGTGTTATPGHLTVSPALLNFGNVNLGTVTTQPSTLSAKGGTITIHSASSSNSQFSISGASFPLTLSPGQSTQVDVAFDPVQSGAISATLTFISNASNSKAIESLDGTGVAPQYSVNLSWNASTSPSISGYNVYRGTTAGVYSKINSALDPSTAYVDNTVASGTTYYYAATAVNSSGEESTYSSPTQVVIP